MTRENAVSKAKRYLAEGRLVIIETRPGYVEATARGDGAIHRLGYLRGRWWCACPARSTQCSHLRALRLVTCPDLPDPLGDVAPVGA